MAAACYLALLLVVASAIQHGVSAHQCPAKTMVKLSPVDISACYEKPDAMASYETSFIPASATGMVQGRELLEASHYEHPHTKLRSYNTLTGAAQIGETYQFSQDPNVLEGAKRMVASGARVHKFSLSTYLNRERTNSTASLLEAATHPKLGYKEVFDLPLDRFIFWAYAANKSNTFNEFYDLATHLVTKYKGTGKSFYIGHWEGDWSLRNNSFRGPVLDERIHFFRHQLSEMQRAIDTVRAEQAHLIGGADGVKIWGYAEVNRVLGSMRDPTYRGMINQVVPFIDPPIDMVSYSNWELEDTGEKSADELGPFMHSVLDFIKCHIPAKPCVPEPRVFIGEFGYYLKNYNCSALMAPPKRAVRKADYNRYTPTDAEIVKSRTMWHLANAVAWGSPINMFWQLYSNEVGKDATTGQPCNRGYWLVDEQGRDAPVFTALKSYYSSADSFLADYAHNHNGKLPDVNKYRKWAVGKLAELAGYKDLPVPKVRYIDPDLSNAGGGN